VVGAALVELGDDGMRRCWERFFFFLFDGGPAGAIFHRLAI
jgi:hypothetical protein